MFCKKSPQTVPSMGPMSSTKCCLNRFILIFLIMVTSELCCNCLWALPIAASSPSSSQSRNNEQTVSRRTVASASSDQLNYEQCYYQTNSDIVGKLIKINYGHCMSMNGPDGCCLEGYYKPGLCSNLGHICCTKPDPECSNMKNNKGITRQTMRQQQKMFMKLNAAPDNSKDPDVELGHTFNTRYRPIRSNERTSASRIRTNFEIVEMPAHMQLDAVSFVTTSLDRYRSDFDEAANYLCRMLDQKYPEPTPWACTVGTNFGYSVEPSHGKYMLFYIGNINRIRVMAFASKSASPEN